MFSGCIFKFLNSILNPGSRFVSVSLTFYKSLDNRLRRGGWVASSKDISSPVCDLRSRSNENFKWYWKLEISFENKNNLHWGKPVGPGKINTAITFTQKYISDAMAYFTRPTVRKRDIIRKRTMLCSNRDSCTVTVLKFQLGWPRKNKTGRWKDLKNNFGGDIHTFAASPCYFARLSANGQCDVRIAILPLLNLKMDNGVFESRFLHC